MTKNQNLKISDKFLLTPDEASEYFNISANRLRRLAEFNPKVDITLKKGSHILFKKKQLENFINSLKEL